MRFVPLAVVAVLAAASAVGVAQEPVFRAGVDLVTVDTIVVDKDGRPVTGLTADDFVLTVDGKPRAIDAFELIAVRSNEGAAAGKLPDVSTNDVADPGRMILLVIDRSNLRVGDGRAALDGMKGLVANLSPRDRLGLVSLPGGGPIVQPTTDHQAVLTALGRVRGMEAQHQDPNLQLTISEAIKIDRRVPGTLNKVSERNCIGAGRVGLDEIASDAVSNRQSVFDLCKSRIQNEAGRLMREMRAVNNDVMGAMDQLLEGLRDIEARKTIVYVSHGLVFDSEMQGRLRQFGSRVAAAAATFYAIQLYAPPLDASTGFVAPDWDEDRSIRADGLYYLAGVTGGALFRPASGLGTTPVLIARETSARYALGFQVLPGERDGKAHEIKVKMRRERGLTVRHRTEFVGELRPRRARAPETLGAALSAPEMLPAVPLRVATALVPDGSPQPKVLLAAAVGPAALSSRYARTRLAYEVHDAEGRRIGETEEVDAVTPLYTVALRMKPGRYRVKVAAKDAEGRIGSLEHPFEVSEPPAEGIHVGGTLLFRDGGESAAPVLLVDVPADGRETGVHVFVHAAQAAKLDGLTAIVDVTDLGEQVSRFNGPMTPACAGSACELDANVSMARWPVGRYRADVTVLTHGAVVGRTGRDFELVTVTAPAESTTTQTGESGVRPAPRSAALEALLSKATSYTERYDSRAISTLAEERYVQAIVDAPGIDRERAFAWRDNPDEAKKRSLGVAARRQIASDLLMVKASGGWLLPYRDVAAVDGKPVKDRETRAVQLFTAGGVPAPARLLRIAEEGARYNLGNMRRTVNVPTMALFVLHPRHIGRFDFELAGTATIDGVPTTIVRFQEKRGPTLIQNGRREDMFSNGRLWLAQDGSVRQTDLRVEERNTGLRTRVEVTYKDVPSIGVLLPSEMREQYANVPGDRLRTIEGRATYQNYRVFTVSTSEAPPAQP
jgi:VWFA-related protein